jgi:hypothetical protein
MVQTKEIQPYQPGDFVEGGFGEKTKYKGPIYNVTYPAKFDDMQEAADWQGLGFRVREWFGNDKQGFTIVVLGDIPEWFQDRLKENQIRIEMTKTRGQSIYI